MKRKPKTRPRYKFGLKDYAELLGMSYSAIRKSVERRKFDPYDIKSICEFYCKRKLDGKLGKK